MNASLLSILLVLLVGCTAAEGDDAERVSSGSSALITGNALSHNALSHNALSHNALSHNGLSPDARGAAEEPGAEGDLFRSFLRYTVGCALGASEVYAFSWTDDLGVTHEESYPGQLGLAPGWATGALDVAGQELVSACLAARTNWYGVSVVISMRSIREPLRAAADAETDAYDEIEGAFWGNVFSATPHLSACNKLINVPHSRAAQRDCAAGHVSAMGAVESCGMIAIVGRCNQTCRALRGSGRQYYPECNDGAFGATANVITTALP